MASPENLACSIEPWIFRPTIADSWFTEAIARDAEILTKTLQKSLAGATPETLKPEAVCPFRSLIKPDPTPTPTPTPTPAVSGLSGSDQEPAPKRQRSAVPSARGKVSKRRSRASKKSQTTFITADPANFRHMVQQVTGVRFGYSQGSMAPILKPEPQRLGSRVPAAAGGGGCLPTLDTSALLVDDRQEAVVGPSSAAGTGVSGPFPLPFAPAVGVGAMDHAALVSATAGLDFDTFPCFPTLDSWKAM